jgi:hypothetical protein
MRAYHFLRQEYAISNLALRRMKVSRLNGLNDPFEFFAADLSDRDLRARIPRQKAQISDARGLLCFSSDWCNPVQWSHYADKHRGLCLGFDVPDENCQPIRYIDKRVDVDEDDERLREDLGEALLHTKYKDWHYEQEVRLVVPLDPAQRDEPMQFVDFGDALRLREVILGPRCDLPIGKMRDLVAFSAPGANVVKAQLALRTFRVVAGERTGEGDATT